MKRLLSVLIALGFISSVAFAAVTVTVNGTSHTIPQKGEKGWGDNVTAWIQDISADVLYPAGGTFTLGADVNFGASYGLKSAYFSSRGTASSAGLLRLANTDTVGWRNGANDGDLALSISGDALQFDSVALITDVTGLSALSAVEIDQLENIGATTISATQWGYLGASDQAFATTDDVTFNSLALTALGGDVVGTSATQTLTNKTIDADNNTISNLAIGAEVSSSVASTLNLTATNELRFQDTTGGEYFGLKAPGTISSSFTLTLPADAGSDGQTLTTNGTDTLTWEDPPTAPSVPTIQKFTSGSGTYTTPANVRWIKVRMVGGGGGGAGSGTGASSPTAPGAGGNTTFGTSLLVANGGAGAVYNSAAGAGGTASLGTGPIGIALTGAVGGGGVYADVAALRTPGGNGASSPFGGAGAGGQHTAAGNPAVANTGSGGGGAGVGDSTTDLVTGPGGGAGGFVDAIITSPSASYSYAVGSGGAGGAAGTTGYAGGAGGSGVIIVEEYY